LMLPSASRMAASLRVSRARSISTKICSPHMHPKWQEVRPLLMASGGWLDLMGWVLTVATEVV
jgi:hypothetical protein